MSELNSAVISLTTKVELYLTPCGLMNKIKIYDEFSWLANGVWPHMYISHVLPIAVSVSDVMSHFMTCRCG